MQTMDPKPGPKLTGLRKAHVCVGLAVFFARSWLQNVQAIYKTDLYWGGTLKINSTYTANLINNSEPEIEA